MLKKFLIASTVLALSCPAPASAEGACYSCGAWVNWGQREQVCASPSEGLLDNLIACLRRPNGDPSGGCATSCADYLISYDACAASGDPSCEPGAPFVCGSSPSDCDFCRASPSGCGAYNDPCSADATECVHCNTYLDGGYDGNLLCPASIQPEVDLSTCACSGGCAAKCSSACSHPCGWVLDPAAASFQCAKCLFAGACSTQYAACSSN